MKTAVVYNDLYQLQPKGERHWMTETNSLNCGLQVSSTVLPNCDFDVPVRVMNVKQEPITVSAGTIISTWEPVEVCEQSGVSDDAEKVCCEDPLLAEMVSRVDENVSDADR